MRTNFLNISKAFDRVWHEGLLFKLERIGISGNLLSIHRSFLSNRFQRVVLNGQCCRWSSVLAGVPEGFILVPATRLFADDTSLFSTVYDPNISAS